MFVDIKQMKIVSENEIRQAHKETSFPPKLTLESISYLGYVELSEAETPAVEDDEYLDTEGVVKVGDSYVVNWIKVKKEASQIIAEYEQVLDSYFDEVAKSKRYDSRFTLALRAGYEGPYQEEASAFATWMDACNQIAYGLMESIMSGEVQLPSKSEFLNTLPLLVWPTDA